MTTRVRKPGEDDWKNLRRLIGYLKQVIEFSLILSGDSINIIKWWVDASYEAHNKMWGHTGGTLSMGKNG